MLSAQRHLHFATVAKRLCGTNNYCYQNRYQTFNYLVIHAEIEQLKLLLETSCECNRWLKRMTPPQLD